MDINGTQKRLIIVDTAASDDYLTMSEHDCFHGDALLLCCDLQMHESLKNMERKRKQFLHHSKKCIMVAVNKVDLGLTGFQLSVQDVQRFANCYALLNVVQTSALNNIGVVEAFTKLVCYCLADNLCHI